MEGLGSFEDGISRSLPPTITDVTKPGADFGCARSEGTEGGALVQHFYVHNNNYNNNNDNNDNYPSVEGKRVG